MAGKKEIGVTSCPDCGIVAITDPEKLILFLPKGLADPKAEIVCEECGKSFRVSVSWENAYKFDRYNCPVVGFSPNRGKPFNDEDIEEFMDNLEDYLEEFLTIIDKEGGLSL